MRKREIRTDDGELVVHFIPETPADFEQLIRMYQDGEAEASVEPYEDDEREPVAEERAL